MSKKDVKDELKEMEGQPEVRQQIRRKQRELAEQRMLDEVPNADVVITNPSHFAVALIYDIDSEMAPRVVAKGQDFMAQRIKERARESEVLVFEAPPLARALYFSVDVGFASLRLCSIRLHKLSHTFMGSMPQISARKT